MNYVLDRFEEDIAIIEQSGDPPSYINVKRSLISPDAREGDVLVPDGGGYRANKELTALRKKDLLKKIKELNNTQKS